MVELAEMKINFLVNQIKFFFYFPASDTPTDHLDDYMAESLAEMEISFLINQSLNYLIKSFFSP